MKTIELSFPHLLLNEELPDTVGAIGFFDGVHMGHQKVIQTAVEQAKRENTESAVITFHPHPSVVLNKKTTQAKYITPIQEKQKILQKLGVDRLYIIEFNKELSMLSPEEFITHFILGLEIKHLVAGFDFTYGHKGKGSMDNIHMYAKDKFTTEVISKVTSDQEKISSTKIRGLLKCGNIEEVNTLLGRPLRLNGIVIDGDKRGRTIGFPTANLKTSADVLFPKQGVYAVKVYHKNIAYEGMANLGTKPTFAPDVLELSVEVNIFDYDNDLYGEELQLEWYHYIRDEVKFNHVTELISQLKQDEIRAREYFSKLKKK